MSTSLMTLTQEKPSSTLRPRSMMRVYQQNAEAFILKYPQTALWLGMGLGKTVVSLSSIVERLDACEVCGVLVIAPLRVMQMVWRQEAAKWEHTRHLRFSIIHGTPDIRTRAYHVPADVYLVNYEGLTWLANQLVHHYLSRGRYLPFNMVVFDEVSRLRDVSTQRHRALRKLLPFIPYRVGLTGTPAADGYIDLFGQYLAIDSGARLGTSKTTYVQTYFHQEGWGMGAKPELDAGADKRIERAIRDITLQMNAEDYLQLPPIMFNDIWIDLPPDARALYEQLEREMFIELDSGAEVEVFNAAALTGKCLQAANGALYTSTGGPWEELHTAKLEALEDVVEEAAGKPLLLAYNFRHDAARIEAKYVKAEHLSSKLGARRTEDLVSRWNRQQVPMLIGHPASMGHGLNLQEGSDTLVWFGLPWSLELYLQTIDRLAGGLRRTRPVMVHRLLARETTDVAVKETLATKATTQEGLKQALNEYRRQKHA